MLHWYVALREVLDLISDQLTEQSEAHNPLRVDNSITVRYKRCRGDRPGLDSRWMLYSAVRCLPLPAHQIHGSPEAQNATLFANRVSVAVTKGKVEMRSSWIGVTP